MSTYTLHLGDNMEILKTVEDNSVDAIVTDPPYGLFFMGRKWDYDVASTDLWVACLRVLKPGGHLLCFSGTRTYHRAVTYIEDAGFEIRDMIAWVYGSGFPKSLNISKAIDKKYGVESEVEAKQWEGWGTALKPALEPIVLARKPLAAKTVAENVLQWGVGGLNIDECRVETEDTWYNTEGRFPSNFVHDGSADVVGLLPNNSARYFYCAKASKKDRDDGLDGFNIGKVGHGNLGPSIERFNTVGRNTHPTVKPTALMQYLVRLITPPNGIVLDPFMGSGSTGKACMLEGFNFIGIEKEQEYLEIAEARLCQTKASQST